MLILLNVILVGLVALIAYWWANQGAFSAFLHMLCVIVAGAITLAVWEPLVVNFVLKGGGFDDYAWGIVLIGVFTITLFILRFALDKLIPDNLNTPTWANYAFGGLFGAIAGVITIGMFMIGAGFLQTSTEIMGFVGVARATSAPCQPVKLNVLYPPLHEWTEEFYAFVSDGALSPMFSPVSMRNAYPELANQAISLHRDSYSDGGGKTSVSPGAVRVEGFVECDECQIDGVRGKGFYGVLLQFDKSAFDFGEQLTLSNAQARLIGTGDAWREAPVAYPYAWYQPGGGAGDMLQYIFDDLTHYATSVPGQQSAPVMLIFLKDDLDGTPPAFVQVKGLRMTLPQLVKATSTGELRAAAAGSAIGTPIALSSAAPQMGQAIRVDSTLPMTLSANQLSSIKYVEGEDGNALDSGRQSFNKGGSQLVGKQLRVRGIYEPRGTRVIKLDVSRRSSPIDLYGDRSDVGKNLDRKEMPRLVDAQGRGYQPIGYIWDRPNEMEINLDPANGISSLEQLPTLASAGTDKLYLVFRVTTGTQIRGFVVGDTTLGLCDVVVTEN